MKKLLAKLEKELAGHKKGIAQKDKQCEKDQDIQDDTEWVNDYYNQQGWVEALEYVIAELKALDK